MCTNGDLLSIWKVVEIVCGFVYKDSMINSHGLTTSIHTSMARSQTV